MDNPNPAEFVEIQNSALFAIDLRYAGTNNFASRPFYKAGSRCYLHKLAAEKLMHAAEKLKSLKPGWKLLLLDCLRPRSVQYELWALVKGTHMQEYFADPERGSVHNYGFAIDLTLQNEQGIEVDMGTIFDHFGIEAEPRHEARFLETGILTREQVDNRLILRKVMEDSGFKGLQNEWWHFDALDRRALKDYPIIE